MTEPVIGPCGKRTYSSRKVAQKLKRRVNDGGRENVQPYHCCKCHGWHLGTPIGIHGARGRPVAEERYDQRQEADA